MSMHTLLHLPTNSKAKKSYRSWPYNLSAFHRSPAAAQDKEACHAL
jgi:hypothetical protein